jgi:hypothetical protein
MVDAERLVAVLGRVTKRLPVLECYADVDDRLVVANLSRRSDLRAYVRAMSALLDA